MSNNSLNAHQKAPNVIPAWVWYEGTDALFEGEAVCFNNDYGTATDYDARRGNRVERPKSGNNNAFAGVVARNYSAKSVSQLIEIYVPGSMGVNIAVGANVTAGDMLTFTAGLHSESGQFVKGGYSGRGSAVVRQTKAAAIVESSMTGGWSLATDGKTLTMSDTTGLSAGDTVVLLSGSNEGSSKAVVPGKYALASITSGTVCVLSTSAVGATPTGALTCTGYACTGSPKVQADLLTGDESGGVEFVTPPNTGTGTGADMTFMTGGVSFICGGVTIASANANGALADGTALGQKKSFYCLGTLTTNDAIVTLATAGIQNKVLDALDTTAQGAPLALASATFDAAAEQLHLEWFGIWREMVHAGCVLSAS